MSLWHVDYFKLKTIKAQKTQEEPLNKDIDIENGLEDMAGGGGSWGEVRVASTYIHF